MIFKLISELIFGELISGLNLIVLLRRNFYNVCFVRLTNGEIAHYKNIPFNIYSFFVLLSLPGDRRRQINKQELVKQRNTPGTETPGVKKIMANIISHNCIVIFYIFFVFVSKTVEASFGFI